jgi:hypothetical protein
VQLAEVVGGGPHVPKRPAPASPKVQMPPQQSAPVWQRSFCWPQKEPGVQAPFTHSFEQQVLPSLHGLPSELQVELSGVHVPPSQRPPQQSLLAPHEVPSPWHGGSAHTPPAHTFVQHWLGSEHARPRLRHCPPSDPPEPLALVVFEPVEPPPVPVTDVVFEPVVVLVPVVFEPVVLVPVLEPVVLVPVFEPVVFEPVFEPLDFVPLPVFVPDAPPLPAPPEPAELAPLSPLPQLMPELTAAKRGSAMNA